MPVVDTTTDMDNLTLTIVAEFAAPVDRVWQVYDDPRQLEQVWGPPSHPATVVSHELSAGGHMHYYMTSPEDEKFHGGWNVTDVNAPKSFTFSDFFADEDFNPADGMPESVNDYRFESTPEGTRATFVSTFDSAEALQQVLDMGVIEGSKLAINQIDDLLA